MCGSETFSYMQSKVSPLPFQISVNEASKMLLMDSPDQLAQFASQRKWLKDSMGEWFVFSQEEKKEDLHFIKNSLLITQGLGYARELEKIV